MILDLFAGPGGWSLGLRALGLEDEGVEIDPTTCDTRDALGLTTMRADVRDVPDWYGGDLDALIASPPCQTFSQAGLRQGFHDPRGDLVWQPLRFIHTALPPVVVMEEVPTVLPVFQVYRTELERVGYSVWCGLLNAADYGVPQSRTRAFLIARTDGLAEPPAPTHTASPAVDDSLFGHDTRLAWVTMAEALPHRTDLPAWCHTRPATTVVRSFRPDVIAAPGWRGPGDGPRQNTPNSVVVDLDELAVLQGAWAGFPFKGAATKRFSICGALLPPPWAKAILGHALGSQFVSTP